MCVFLCVRACMLVYMSDFCVHVFVFVCVSVFGFIYVCLCVFDCLCLLVCLYVYKCV